MTNPNFSSIEEYQDIESKEVWKIAKKLLFPKWLRLKMLNTTSRDNARTPMQWDSSENAGFTKEGVSPWIKINPNYKNVNAKTESSDSNSVLNWYKNLIALRKTYPQLLGGNFKMLYKSSKIFAFERVLKGIGDGKDRKTITVLSFSERTKSLPTEIKKELETISNPKILCSIYDTIDKLPPYAAFVVSNTEKSF